MLRPLNGPDTCDYSVWCFGAGQVLGGRRIPRPHCHLACRDLSRRFTTAARLVAVPEPDKANQLANYAVSPRGGSSWGASLAACVAVAAPGQPACCLLPVCGLAACRNGAWLQEYLFMRSNQLNLSHALVDNLAMAEEKAHIGLVGQTTVRWVLLAFGTWLTWKAPHGPL